MSFDDHMRGIEESLDLARTLLAGDCDQADAIEANALVGHALRLDPDSAAAWIVKCQVMSALDDDIGALAAIEMALRIDNRSVEAYYWSSAVLTDLDRSAEALKAINRAFRYVGVDDFWLLEDLYCEKAMILDALGESEQAVKTYEDGLRRCPSSSLLRAGLAPYRRAATRSKLQVIRGGIA